MLTYKVGFVSNFWTPRVINRVVRDVLTSARLCKVNDIRLIVATNHDISKMLVGVQGIRFTTDLAACEIYRLYVDESVPRQDDKEPEQFMPDGVFDYETITVAQKPQPRNLHVDEDPYAGAYLPDRFERIPSTIDQMRNAPKPEVQDEPEWGPWLT